MNICGKPARHEHVPWFWSDQYDLKLQIAGLSTGYDQTVIRGDPDGTKFALYYLAQGELLAVDAVNSPKDFMTGKKWIAERKRPDPCEARRPRRRPQDDVMADSRVRAAAEDSSNERR